MASHPAASFVEAATYPGAAEALAQGDADGDARGDVLLRAVQSSRGSTLTVLRLVSSDAGERWSWSSESQWLDVFPAVDLDGDARTDVLVLARDAKDALRPWRLLALRGADGATMWEAGEAGEGTPLAVGPASATAQPARDVAAFVGGDADGDGGADVWLHVLDTADAAVEEVGVVGGGVLRVSVLSGASGATLSQAQLPLGPGGVGAAFPAGDLDGDGRADTLATLIPARFDVARAASIIALSADGAPLWARAYAPGLAIGIPVGDVTGDGRDDAIVSISDDLGRSIEVVGGADGLSAWRHEDPLFLVSLPGDVDGAGGLDVLMMEGDVRAGVVEVRAVLLRGEDGSLLYDERPFGLPLPENGGTSIEYRTTAGDFDGDGLLDALLLYESGVGEEILLDGAVVVRAADGAASWDVPTSARAFEVRDATGDGADDVALLLGLEASLLDGRTGLALWSDVLEGFTGGALLSAGDVGGDARADVTGAFIVEVPKAAADGPGGEASTTIVAWDAAGARVWAPADPKRSA